MINQMRELNNLVIITAVKLGLAYFSTKVKHRLQQPGAPSRFGKPRKVPYYIDDGI